MYMYIPSYSFTSLCAAREGTDLIASLHQLLPAFVIGIDLPAAYISTLFATLPFFPFLLIYSCIVHPFVCVRLIVSALALKIVEQLDEVKMWTAEEELACAELKVGQVSV